MQIVNRCNLNKSIYQFLTPNDKAEHIAEYSKALKDALENKMVKNIAISGSYGSGKTSFIKTFEKNNAQYSFLDISLATFKDGSGKKEDLSSIEKSIIEQMFYRVKNKTIPQSRLKKINRLKWIWIKIIFILLVALSYFVLFQPQVFKDIPSLKWLLEINSSEYLKYLPIVFLVLGVYYVASKLIIVISNTNIDKLSLQNLELKYDGGSASLLNQYLDEILYFFEKTNFDVVVFQDLDRFNNLDIFTKLRELNNFVNNSEQVSRRVVFLYAVKDEMFQNANERTKFFDFLIPIIPYINATNSKDKLLEYFGDKVTDKSFLYDISLYIPDMRLLKNIYNEYLMYSSNLGEKLDKTKLLAMIVYKNFEPKDFEKLHKCKGLVYDIFHSEKKEYLGLHLAKIENKIIDIKKYIQEIEEEQRENIKELRLLYILKIIENSNNQFTKTIFTSSKSFTIQSSIEDDNFQSIIESNGLGTYNQQSQYLNIKFVDIEKELGSYKKRAGLVLDKTNGKKNTLLKEIEDLKKAQDRLKETSLKELFEEFNDVTIFENIVQEEAKKFDNHELMKYLLSYGHIDENYEEYISNFFGVSITKDEQWFLRNVKNSGETLSFDYELKNLEDIAKFRLSENEFNKQSVLNLHLTDYLLENKNTYKKKIEKLFQQLSNEGDISKKFILYCLDNSSKNIEFARLIVKYYKRLWLHIFQELQLTLEKQKEYFSLLLEALDKTALISLNMDDSVKIFIENSSYLPSYGRNNYVFESLIQELQVKYQSLSFDDIKRVPPTINYIFKNELYELNPEMVWAYIDRFKVNDTFRDKLSTSNYTTIKEHRNEMTRELLAYMQNEINQYVQNVLLELPGNTEESEESLIELLNLDSLDEGLKLKIIEKEETKISDIGSIDKALWEHLVRHNKVVANWDNAFKYFNDDDSDNDLLLDYLNIEENAEKISQIRCDSNYKDSHEFFDGKLLRLIIETNAFNVTSYEYLVKNLGYWYEDLDISKLDEDKVALLIKYGRFQFKKACFDALKAKNSVLHIALIEKNKDKLLEEFDNFQFNTEDIEKILEINESILSDAIKKDLVGKIDTELIVNKNIARLIYKYVDRGNIKPIEYTKKMLQNLESLESKINLMVEQDGGLSENGFVEILDLLPEEYSKIGNLDGKQTVLQDNYYNQKLISVLRDKDFITSHREEKDNKIRLFIKDKS